MTMLEVDAHAIPNERDIQMSLKQWCVRSVLACTLSSTGAASADDLKFNGQVDLSLNGQIRSVGACNLTLENGGVVDIGNLSKDDFPKDSYFTLERSMSFQVGCPRPTKVGFVLIDNVGAGDQNDQSFSLSNPKIGSYYMVLSTGDYRVVDGKRAQSLLHSYGDTWKSASWGGWDVIRGRTYSWGVGGSDPAAGTWMQDMLRISVSFEPQDIPFTDEMEIAGSATLELVYL
ncbi:MULTISPECIES: DUF1120 domain-containing protein [unclassified Burkholderia]|uniref:DUF1120 domain-containing protein n=1 Tax=unclassified Burkholderia TaxID=2613784 RepID=UPI000B7AC88A|nr:MULTISPECIES: DUF1120 domain-containing protein [unclassified Burkholderia]MCA8064031.1 DUF1120 domain-containing protein [Burkholderia sp. AU38729]OXI15246.1 hypothetical protein CFB43_32435 [Burkholderia sp. AU15512]